MIMCAHQTDKLSVSWHCIFLWLSFYIMLRNAVHIHFYASGHIYWPVLNGLGHEMKSVWNRSNRIMLRVLFEWPAPTSYLWSSANPSESIELIQLSFIVKNRFICKIFSWIEKKNFFSLDVFFLVHRLEPEQSRNNVGKKDFYKSR